MKEIIVLGTGCAKCHKTADIIQKIASEKNIEVSIKNETNPEVMMSYGVMSTPAVVIDGSVVHSGSIPHRSDIESWL